MAKRFTDTLIWDKVWFMKLSTKHKCLLKYIYDRCDAAGVWEANWIIAPIYVGEQVSVNDLEVFGDQIEDIGNGKFFIPGFINFQYGTLSEKSPAHNPVFASLKKHNLLDRVFNRVSNTLQDKDKDKEENKDKEKVKVTDLLIKNTLELHKGMIQGQASKHKLLYDEAHDLIKGFLEEQRDIGYEYDDMNDLKKHIVNWLRKHMEAEKKNTDRLGQKHTSNEHVKITKL